MRLLLTLVLAFSALWPRGDIAPQPARQDAPGATLAASLLHYWPMSESSATAPRVDLAGGLALTPSGDGVPTTAGHIYRYAALWDGTVADALILTKAEYTGTDLDAEGHYPRTYAAWVYPVGEWSHMVGYYDFVWQRQEGLGHGGEELFFNAWGGAIYRIYSNVTNDVGLCDGVPNARNGEWSLIFWTHDPDTDSIYTHVYSPDGPHIEDHIVPLGDWPYGLSSVTDNPVAPAGQGDLHIGGASLHTEKPRNAHFALGPLMVFDKVLDTSEKDELWNNGAGLPYSALAPQRLYLPVLSRS
jgi:hypothetical protein